MSKSKRPKETIIQKCSVIDLLKLRSVTPAISSPPIIACPFSPYDFKKGPKCSNVMFIYLNVESSSNTLGSCIRAIYNLFVLETSTKTYSSSFLVESNGFGCITVLISLTHKTAITDPEKFVFNNIIPTIHLIEDLKQGEAFLVANYKNTDFYTERYFYATSYLV
jgi:hypothetical protein